MMRVFGSVDFPHWSMSACKLDPEPEIKTVRRVGDDDDSDITTSFDALRGACEC